MPTEAHAKDRGGWADEFYHRNNGQHRIKGIGDTNDDYDTNTFSSSITTLGASLIEIRKVWLMDNYQQLSPLGSACFSVMYGRYKDMGKKRGTQIGQQIYTRQRITGLCFLVLRRLAGRPILVGGLVGRFRGRSSQTHTGSLLTCSYGLVIGMFQRESLAAIKEKEPANSFSYTISLYPFI